MTDVAAIYFLDDFSNSPADETKRLELIGNRIDADNWKLLGRAQLATNTVAHVLLEGDASTPSATARLYARKEGATEAYAYVQNDDTERGVKLSPLLMLAPLSSDPSLLVDGAMWYRSDLDEIRVRVNGATRKLDHSAV